jgi:hypothetical protein
VSSRSTSTTTLANSASPQRIPNRDTVPSVLESPTIVVISHLTQTARGAGVTDDRRDQPPGWPKTLNSQQECCEACDVEPDCVAGVFGSPPGPGAQCWFKDADDVKFKGEPFAGKQTVACIVQDVPASVKFTLKLTWILVVTSSALRPPTYNAVYCPAAVTNCALFALLLHAGHVLGVHNRMRCRKQVRARQVWLERHSARKLFPRDGWADRRWGGFHTRRV